MSERTPRKTTALPHVGRQAMVRPPSVVLRVVAGDDAGKSVPVAIDRVCVGSHPSAGLVLTDPAVSRFHFEIGFCPEGLSVADLGSTNGTSVSGLRVKEAFVEPGATIRVGRTTLEVAAPTEGVEVAVLASNRLGRLVGTSVPMRHLFASIARVARHDIPVLIQGETGTGKEVVAREIHAQSGRRQGPFVVVDCGAIPPDLAESELFGHSKGAFSGATAERRGAFESADGGTLFLDEVGELGVELQPRLLRAVEAHEVKRVGSDVYRPVDVRVVAATHRDLRVAVNQATFREDLYYRLAVVTLFVPPLRERTEDIPHLLTHFQAEAAEAYGLPSAPPPFLPEEVSRLSRHPWNGNCRELRNFVDRSLVLEGENALGDAETRGVATQRSGDGGGSGDGTSMEKSGSATVPVRAEMSYREARTAWLDDFERAYVSARLQMTGGNVSRAAREMGIDRAYLVRLIKRSGVR